MAATDRGVRLPASAAATAGRQADQNKGTVLVTGGAGYIGSHMALGLLDAGEKVVVLDNLTTGVRALVPSGATFIEGSVADRPLVQDILQKHGIQAIIHFAGSTVVPATACRRADGSR